MLDTGWFTSSRSGSGNDHCVEVRLGPVVGVRDSKDREGPRLVVRPTAWASFLGAVRTGRFGS